MSWHGVGLGPLSLEEASRRLVGAPGAFRLRDGERTVLGAFPVEASEGIDPEPGLVPELGASRLPRWVGLLPYEAFRELEGSGRQEEREAPLLERPSWRRYAAVAVHERGELRVEGEDAAAVERLVGTLGAAVRGSRPPASLRFAARPEPGGAHAERVRRALDWIARGQLYQVNLARCFELAVEGHPFELLEALGGAAGAPFSLALDFDGLGVVSGSPELFLDVGPEGRVETRPIKGTRPRGRTPEEDLGLRMELEGSEKERAELTMVVDLERNDLGRIARVGTVEVSELPHVVTHPTVHHREAAVSAWLREGVGRAELLRATVPSGSVTGAPKKKAMELIAELEPVRRGLYTGALGTLSHDGRLRLSMAIRVLVLRGGRGHYYTGGGIVADSVPDAEVAETWWKARWLSPLLPGLLDAEN
ncbi:MAG TPA: anthranilate synthase component I family protein [Polyangiaceae bacterium]|nr:anthranilate synthase component I family protein [Polyangiaceae bacterium]